MRGLHGLVFALALLLATTASSAGAAPSDLRIVVKKASRRLFLYDADNHLLKTYRIALGRQPTGAKREEGDGATPEGEYYVTHGNPRSHFHLSLGLSYPNADDARSGLSRGAITKAEQESIADAIARHATPPQHTRLGGDIFLHGGGASTDWTAGCIALENADIDDLFQRVPVGAHVTILP